MSDAKKKEIERDLVMNPEPIEVSQFTGTPKIPVMHVVSSNRVLQNAAPEDADRQEREQLVVVDGAAHRVEVILNDRQSVAAVRPFFMDCVNSWGGVYDGLTAKSRIPMAVSPLGDRASRMLAAFFPSGLGWVRQDAYAVWGECKRLLGLARDRKMQRELDALLGEGTFAVLEKATADLGEALGTGSGRRELPEGTALADATAVYCREVGRYARICAAKYDETDPRSIERFRRAVAKPIDQFRVRRNGSSGTDVLEPETPVSPADPAGPAPQPEQPQPGPLVDPAEPTPSA